MPLHRQGPHTAPPAARAYPKFSLLNYKAAIAPSIAFKTGKTPLRIAQKKLRSLWSSSTDPHHLNIQFKMAGLRREQQKIKAFIAPAGWKA